MVGPFNYGSGYGAANPLGLMDPRKYGPQAPNAQTAPQQPGFLERLTGNPLFGLGLSALAAGQRGGGGWGAFGPQAMGQMAYHQQRKKEQEREKFLEDFLPENLRPLAKAGYGREAVAASLDNPQEGMTEYQRAQLGLARDKFEWEKQSAGQDANPLAGDFQGYVNGELRDLYRTGRGEVLDMATLRPVDVEAISYEAPPDEMAKIKDRSRLMDRAAENEALYDVIDRAKGQSHNFNTGWLGWTPAVPGFGGDLQASLDEIEATVGFNYLTKMRELSKTGGALGNVSNQELKSLQSVMGGLRRAQSQKQFDENLERLKQRLMEAERNIAAQYELQYGEPLPAGYFGGEGEPQQNGGSANIPPRPPAASQMGVTDALWAAMTPEERAKFQ